MPTPSRSSQTDAQRASCRRSCSATRQKHGPLNQLASMARFPNGHPGAGPQGGATGSWCWRLPLLSPSWLPKTCSRGLDDATELLRPDWDLASRWPSIAAGFRRSIHDATANGRGRYWAGCYQFLLFAEKKKRGRMGPQEAGAYRRPSPRHPVFTPHGSCLPGGGNSLGGCGC